MVLQLELSVTNVPDTGSTLALLGLGLVGLARGQAQDGTGMNVGELEEIKELRTLNAELLAALKLARSEIENGYRSTVRDIFDTAITKAEGRE